MSLTLLIGGARSGKSSIALDIARRHDAAGLDVTFVATAPVTDDDMAGRVERHRAERPDRWRTIEEQTDLERAIDSVGRGLVVVDCLNLWTSNLMWAGHSDDEIRGRAAHTATLAASRQDPTVAVTNEVGMGVHPETELGRRFRDVLGWVNQEWAAVAAPALLLIAGRAVRLDDPWTLLTEPITSGAAGTD